MNFDPDKFVEALTIAIRTNRPFAEGLREMIDWRANHSPHDDWEKIKALDYTEDYPKAAKCIPGVLKKSPAPFEIRALYFGLAEMANSKDEEFADLYVAFLGQFDATDEKSGWVYGELRHYPEKSSFKIKALKSAGLIFNRSSGEGMGNDGNFMFAMSYAMLLVVSLMTPELYISLSSRADSIGILAGWDSGDLMRPGQLSRLGFVPNTDSMI